MKKIMIVAAALAMAFGVQAASVDWKVAQNTTTYKTGTWNVYAFANTTSAALAAICSSTDSSTWTQLGTSAGTLSTARGAKSGSTNGYTAGSAASLTFVLVDGDIEEGSDYLVLTTDDVKSYVYEGSQSATTFQKAITDNIASSGTFTAVPEPTSGLLIILGIAGLALRRRRA